MSAVPVVWCRCSWHCSGHSPHTHGVSCPALVPSGLCGRRCPPTGAFFSVDASRPPAALGPAGSSGTAHGKAGAGGTRAGYRARMPWQWWTPHLGEALSWTPLCTGSTCSNTQQVPDASGGPVIATLAFDVLGRCCAALCGLSPAQRWPWLPGIKVCCLPSPMCPGCCRVRRSTGAASPVALRRAVLCCVRGVGIETAQEVWLLQAGGAGHVRVTCVSGAGLAPCWGSCRLNVGRRLGEGTTLFWTHDRSAWLAGCALFIACVQGERALHCSLGLMSCLLGKRAETCGLQVCFLGMCHRHQGGRTYTAGAAPPYAGASC